MAIFSYNQEKGDPWYKNYHYDEEDIQNIINTGKVRKERVYELADDAIRVGVGFREEWVRMNLDEVMEMFDKSNPIK